MLKSTFRWAATAAALGYAMGAAAQVPPPPPGPAGALPPPPAGAEGAYDYRNAAPVARGTVTRYLMNPNGDVDGLLLSDGTQVKFAAHMSTELVAAIKPGQSVSVRGIRETATSVKAFIIANGTSSVAEHEPAEPPTPPGALAALTAQGLVQHLLSGPRGNVDGLVLSDGSIVHFPPPAATQIGALLQVGQPLTATGYGTQNQYGKSLEATTIGTTGQSPVTLYGPVGRPLQAAPMQAAP